MDTNTAIYSIKKMTRRIEVGEFNKNQISSTLLDIRRMLNSLDLREEASIIREVSHELAGIKYGVKSVISRLDHVMSSLKKVKEKKMVMECREASARRTFFKKGGNHRDMKPVKSLSLYDVIIVPTQGGFHYSVVAGIQQNDSVVCYPLTTGSKQDLEKVGCKAVQLSGTGNGRYKDSFITSACTTIPYYAALNCYVGKLDNVSDVRNAIEGFKQYQ